ncbi:50S ribosomal protein L9 [Endomicrobium proavitum]|uniref:Large ribosomal subunit protein bL9 n=1 Tax=Endomicrobium proavitum TaxID=1408281 RepID=A0A0G3WIS0_9BACT|nr:50S ribosomal protein L9 [Endomicrobium proavitum]AKL97394.1 50S ribosomal protein L9 [Endomicrobium proavitum]
MKVILRSDITNVGRQGEIKDVSAGFVRNYLVPQNLAMEATPQNLKIWEREKVKLEKQREEVIAAANTLGEKLTAEEFSAKVKVGENGKVFGSITTATVAKILEEKGFNVNKRDILLSDNIKELGNYEISVRLHPEVAVKIKLAVTGEKE